jgi:hypothetical protein
MSDPEALRSVVFDVIKNQMRDGTPPETKHTYDRLLAEGYSEEEVMMYISCVVVSEVFSALDEGRTFDEPRYVAALRDLPRLPRVEA